MTSFDYFIVHRPRTEDDLYSSTDEQEAREQFAEACLATDNTDEALLLEGWTVTERGEFRTVLARRARMS